MSHSSPIPPPRHHASLLSRSAGRGVSEADEEGGGRRKPRPQTDAQPKEVRGEGRDLAKVSR